MKLIYYGKYLTKNKAKNITELEEIKEKFILVNKNFYFQIIDEINEILITKGKVMINKKELSCSKMFKFIKKYNSIDIFFSDDSLLKYRK